MTTKALAAGALAAPAAQAAPAGARKRLGIGMHSYGAHWRAARQNHPQAPFGDALAFLEYARQLGAGGVQVTITRKEPEYTAQIRERAERFCMYFEAQGELPRTDADLERFETDVQAAKAAGATVMRTAALGSRRYETFNAMEDFQRFRESAREALRRAEPVLRRHRVRLALENHKDWLVPELLDNLAWLSSEWIGVCVDTGNSIALLEDAMEVVRAYAPFAASTHLKDMAVRPHADGFLLSEVPLGRGYLAIDEIVALLQKANPAIQFNLEMITRNPLPVGCLTPKYWATMEARPAEVLARALDRVRKSAATAPLPETAGLTLEQQLQFEDANVRESLAYAARRLDL